MATTAGGPRLRAAAFAAAAAAAACHAVGAVARALGCLAESAAVIAAGIAASSAAYLLEPVSGKELEVEDRVAAIRPVLEERVGAALEGRQPLLPAAVRARRNCAKHADFGAGGNLLKCADAEIKRRQRGGRRLCRTADQNLRRNRHHGRSVHN